MLNLQSNNIVVIKKNEANFPLSFIKNFFQNKNIYLSSDNEYVFNANLKDKDVILIDYFDIVFYSVNFEQFMQDLEKHKHNKIIVIFNIEMLNNINQYKLCSLANSVIKFNYDSNTGFCHTFNEKTNEKAHYKIDNYDNYNAIKQPYGFLHNTNNIIRFDVKNNVLELKFLILKAIKEMFENGNQTKIVYVSKDEKQLIKTRADKLQLDINNITIIDDCNFETIEENTTIIIDDLSQYIIDKDLNRVILDFECLARKKSICFILCIDNIIDIINNDNIKQIYDLEVPENNFAKLILNKNRFNVELENFIWEYNNIFNRENK